MTSPPTPDHPIFSSATMRIGDDRRAKGAKGVLTHVSPVSGKSLGPFPAGGAEEADAAISAAQRAFPKWRDMLPQARRDILLKAARLIQERASELSTIASHETGALFNPAQVAGSAEQLIYYAGWIDKLEGATIPLGRGALDYTKHEPYGVVVGITCWNGPITSALMKLAPALAAGNCVIIKPPELGPFATLVLAQIFEDAGLPSGVLNIVTGGPEAGHSLVQDKRVGKISFTGGIATARHILRTAAEHTTPVVTELGGKSANIVFADAKLDTAAGMSAMMGCLVHAGQGCLFPTRLFVQDTIYNEFVEKVVAIVRNAKVGNPFDPEVRTGPVISENAVDRILDRIRGAEKNNEGELLTGGERVGGEFISGFYVTPAVFGNVDNSSGLAQNEVFGPVLSILKFSHEEEAVAMANDSDYGLAGYVHTENLNRAHRVANSLEVGYVGVNGFPPMPVQAPFGGYKQSGSGRENGRAGIEEYLRTKNVYIPLT